MKVTVSTSEDLGDKVVQIDVEASELVENVKAILEAETGVALADQVLVYNGTEVSEKNGATLANYNVQDNDLLMLLSRSALGNAAGAGPGPGPGTGTGTGASPSPSPAAAAAGAGGESSALKMDANGLPVNMQAFMDHVASNQGVLAQ